MQYISRNVFHLKFGKAKEALQLWKDYLSKVDLPPDKYDFRLLSDLTGSAYVLVLEITVSTFENLDASNNELLKDASWREFYNQFIPLCNRSERTFYKVEFEM